uniref:Uncharacterized protein n=1 Tax=Schistosoma mansoni TaxID=6183 RepID=A0A5K4EYE6_SCHMA
MPQKDQVVRQQPGNPSRSGTPTSRGASPYPNRWASRSPRRNDTCCCLCGQFFQTNLLLSLTRIFLIMYQLTRRGAL